MHSSPPESSSSADSLAAGPTEPSDQVVADFWSFARDHVGWATVEGLFGQQQASTMIPPWMHLGESSELATARAQQLIHDGTLEVSEPAQIYPADSLPQRGDLAVVVDGSGRPVALAAALAVSISTNPSSSSPADGGDPDAGDTGEDAGKIVTETLRCLYPTGD